MSNNTKYRILQFCFSAMFSVGYGYVAYYLGEFGYSSSEIGLLTSGFAILAAFLQPMLGRIADRNVRFGWKTQLLLMSVLCLIDLVILVFLKHRILVGFLFAVLILFINCIVPIANAAGFYYENSDEPIDYGVARGLGSLGYAIISALIGQLVLRTGKVSVPLTGVVLMVIMTWMVWLLPYDYNEVKTLPKEAQHPKTNFFKKYPAFMTMIVSCVFLLSFHNMAQTYLINIVGQYGGDASTIGIALAISAIFELPPMFLLSRLVKRVRTEYLMLFASFGFILKAVGYYLSNSVGFLYGVQTIQMIAYAITISASVYYTNAYMEKEDAVTGHAIMSMIISIGTVIGNLLGGYLLDYFGIRVLLIVGIVLAMIGFLFAVWSVQLHRKEA